jgi:hypothetical protein
MPGEQLLTLLNPRTRRRRKAHRAHRARRVNPFRRKHRARRRNPVRHYRRRAYRARRRNPMRRRRRNPFLGGSLTNDVLMPAALGAAGGIGLGLLWNSLSPNLPATLTSNSVAATATQAAAAVGLGWLAGKALGNQKGAALAAGALAIVGYNFLESTIAGVGLPAFAGVGLRIPMGAYMPGQGLGRVTRRVPLSAYPPGQGLRGLRGVSRFNPAPMLTGLRGVQSDPGMSCITNPGGSDSMF